MSLYTKSVFCEEKELVANLLREDARTGLEHRACYVLGAHYNYFCLFFFFLDCFVLTLVE